ncbi:MAG TPA: hypothetical protein VHB48_11805, partial [Chitinophagaceae bacterium]|nr:hypothetical protein [Chitinophagaceae bacterium]
NITISNMEVYIAKGKADEGYDYEGPVEDQPRNTCPVVMTGLPGAPLTGVYLYNVAIHYPAGGNRFVARRSVDELDSIPELPARYPEFSMFKELPAWGFYIRHARRLSMNNVAVYNAAKDYRPAVVTDDVQDAQFEKTTIKIAGNGLPFFQHNCKNITIK